MMIPLTKHGVLPNKHGVPLLFNKMNNRGQHTLGAVHKLCQRPKGGEGVWQMLTLAEKGGKGDLVNADVGLHWLTKGGRGV